MAFNEKQWRAALARAEETGVFYFYSTEEYQVRRWAAQTVQALGADADVTRVDGPAPDIGSVVMAVGTISMFGTRRVVELPQVEPSAMNDADVAALCDLMESAQNAVLVMTTVFKDDKAAKTKKAKQLIDAARRCGFAAACTPPPAADARRFLRVRAAALGAQLEPEAAALMQERCGTDLFLLDSEVSKLAAACGYGVITPQLVGQMSTWNIEASVFDLAGLVQRRERAAALQKLGQLLDLQNDPIAITAALAGTFVDMYRAKCGAAAHRDSTAVHKDFGYRGSDWRLRKASREAARYTRAQLEQMLDILLRLDAQLKRSPADKAVLLQTALCEMMQIGAGA